MLKHGYKWSLSMHVVYIMAIVCLSSQKSNITSNVISKRLT